MGASGDTGFAVNACPEGLFCETKPKSATATACALLALDVDLPALHAQWLAVDPGLASVVRRWQGLRVLRQDPTQVLFSFVCSSCNTVAKIERSVAGMRRRWGAPLGSFDGLEMHAFPDVRVIAEADPEHLRADLWGYRAAYAVACARTLAERGPAWLPSLAATGAESARAELMRLPGVGRKVADCILLFGLRYDEATPVDVHMAREIARRYAPELAGRPLSNAVYAALGGALRSRFGAHAGWVQQYLFVDALSRARTAPPALRHPSPEE